MLNVTLSLDSATWADLRRFVALAEGLPGDEEIVLDCDDNCEVRGIMIVGIPPEIAGGPK